MRKRLFVLTLLISSFAINHNINYVHSHLTQVHFTMAGISDPPISGGIPAFYWDAR